MSKPGWNPKKPVSLPLKGTLGKVNFDLKAGDDLISSQGVRVNVYRTTYCPNVKSIDGAEHEIDCKLCHGSQFIDRFPNETIAFIQSQQNDPQHLVEGLYDGNVVSATFARGIELQYFTLIEVLDFTDIYIQRVKRQQGEVDVLKYPCARVNLLEDQSGKQYFEGPDFQIDVNRCIRWCANKGPSAGTIYSIHYEFPVRFRAIRAMHVNRFLSVTQSGVENQIKAYEQWLLQKDYLVSRKNAMGQDLEPNKIRDSDED